jgi:prepilin-type N-terminal cleavage/methylation domain-containing protein
MQLGVAMVSKHAFTIIELLVVIVIIGIIAGLAIISYSSVIPKAGVS